MALITEHKILQKASDYFELIKNTSSFTEEYLETELDNGYDLFETVSMFNSHIKHLSENDYPIDDETIDLAGRIMAITSAMVVRREERAN